MSLDARQLGEWAKQTAALGLIDVATYLAHEAITADLRERAERARLDPDRLVPLSVWHQTHAPEVTRRTVRRWAASGLLPGAVKDEHGAWWVPANSDRVAIPARPNWGEGR